MLINATPSVASLMPAHYADAVHRRRVQRRECRVPQGASFLLMCGAAVMQLLALVRQNAANL
jgi:hypothetical protein